MAPQVVGEGPPDDAHAPEALADRCGVPAETIQRIAAEIAKVAFERAIELDQPWTDTAGRTYPQMIGRPVAMHAMRGISLHSDGFHTCRAIQLLQMLLGAADTPGSWRYESPFPKPIPGGPPPAGKGAKRTLARVIARQQEVAPISNRSGAVGHEGARAASNNCPGHSRCDERGGGQARVTALRSIRRGQVAAGIAEPFRRLPYSVRND